MQVDVPYGDGARVRLDSGHARVGPRLLPRVIAAARALGLRGSRAHAHSNPRSSLRQHVGTGTEVLSIDFAGKVSVFVELHLAEDFIDKVITVRKFGDAVHVVSSSRALATADESNSSQVRAC